MSHKNVVLEDDWLLIVDTQAEEEPKAGEDEGPRYSLGREPDQRIGDSTLAGKTMGQAFQMLQREYGKCRSRVYIDIGPGRTKTTPIGWVFEKLKEFQDADRARLVGRARFYKHITWVTIAVERTPPRTHHLNIEAGQPV